MYTCIHAYIHGCHRKNAQTQTCTHKHTCYIHACMHALHTCTTYIHISHLITTHDLHTYNHRIHARITQLNTSLANMQTCIAYMHTYEHKNTCKHAYIAYMSTSRTYMHCIALHYIHAYIQYVTSHYITLQANKHTLHAYVHAHA